MTFKMTNNVKLWWYERFKSLKSIHNCILKKQNKNWQKTVYLSAFKIIKLSNNET